MVLEWTRGIHRWHKAEEWQQVEDMPLSDIHQAAVASPSKGRPSTTA